LASWFFRRARETAPVTFFAFGDVLELVLAEVRDELREGERRSRIGDEIHFDLMSNCVHCGLMAMSRSTPSLSPSGWR
jgi:hypothetical protein